MSLVSRCGIPAANSQKFRPRWGLSWASAMVMPGQADSVRARKPCSAIDERDHRLGVGVAPSPTRKYPLGHHTLPYAIAPSATRRGRRSARITASSAAASPPPWAVSGEPPPRPPRSSLTISAAFRPGLRAAALTVRTRPPLAVATATTPGRPCGKRSRTAWASARASWAAPSTVAVTTDASPEPTEWCTATQTFPGPGRSRRRPVRSWRAPRRRRWPLPLTDRFRMRSVVVSSRLCCRRVGAVRGGGRLVSRSGCAVV